MKPTKRILCFLMCFIMILPTVSAVISAQAPEPPMIEASAYIVIERETDTVLLESNADTQLYPASITKLMTALIGVDHIQPDQILTVTNEDIDGLYEQGSSVFLKEGEQIVFSELLKYLLVASGNDAANLIARTVSGSKEDFAILMNEKAQELGCTGTHFANPTGLHDDNHYTTARDISLIAKEVLKNPTLTEICGTAKLVLAPTNMHGETTFFSTNYLLSPYKDNRYVYEGVTGLKTGWTGPAGKCIAATAEKNGISLLTVVLGAPKRDDGSQGSFTETTKLLDYAFQNFKKDIYIPMTEPICEVKVDLAKDDQSSLVLLLEKDYYDILPSGTDRSEISIASVNDADITAPIEKGQVLGRASIIYDGEVRQNINLIASSSVERSQFAYIMSLIKGFFSSLIFKIIVLVIALLIILLVLIRYFNVKNRRRRRGGRYSYRR